MTWYKRMSLHRSTQAMVMDIFPILIPTYTQTTSPYPHHELRYTTLVPLGLGGNGDLADVLPSSITDDSSTGFTSGFCCIPPGGRRTTEARDA